MIDTHCHLNHPDFDPDRDAVLARARAAGVVGCVIPGWDLESSRRAVELAEAADDLWAAVAVHPHYATAFTDSVRDALRALCDHPKVVAVGESGLDFLKDFAPRDAQQRALLGHLALAEETGLPIILHLRAAGREVRDALGAHPAVRAVWHAFEGDLALAEQVAARGDYFGISGVITFAKAEERRRVAASLPADRVLLETDAPWLTPAPHRGTRNEPAYLTLTAEALRRARNLSLDEVQTLARENTRRVFPQICVFEEVG